MALPPTFHRHPGASTGLPPALPPPSHRPSTAVPPTFHLSPLYPHSGGRSARAAFTARVGGEASKLGWVQV